MSGATGSIPTTGSVAASTSRVPLWAMVWGAVFVCSWGGNQFSPLLLMYEERAHYSSVLVNVFLGEEDIRFLNGLETDLEPNDALRIIPSIAGGARR